jgi:serine/threonine-protein kinase
MPPSRQILGGRYELGEVIGSGGMAEVRRGRDLKLGREVAVKLLRADYARDPAFQGRFRREAQSAASLNSPSIVAVYDTGEGELNGAATPYIVMEYVEGQTLRDLLAAEGRLLPRRALEITAAICNALEQAHAAGIVHRDIKPANVMVASSGEVKVMDFGIARALTTSTTTMTQTAAVVGTAHYLSPEQARGEHVDARSDVYSTGCLLYELLTGAPPFTGETSVAVAYQHVREDPTPPSAVEPDVPAAIDAIVLVAMSKNPANRYGSAAEMRADLERAMAGRPVHATPVLQHNEPSLPSVSPTTVLMREPPRRKRGLAYLLLGLAAAAVFVIALVAASQLLDNSSQDLTTPELTHQSLQDAEATLNAQGLAVGDVKFRYTGKNNKGEVIGQSPLAGFFVNKGHPIDLIVSNGIQIVVVPTDLQGLTLDQAKVALNAARIRIGTVVPRNSSAPANQVLGTSPAAGQTAAAGAKITVFISNAHVKVPDVTFQDPSTASNILIQHGFNPVIRNTAVYKKYIHGNLADGLVVSQTPTAATYAATGSTIYIYVDNKITPTHSPKPTSPATTPPTSPTPTTTPKNSATPSG